MPNFIQRKKGFMTTVQIQQQLQQVLQQQERGLVFDIDGTLSPIAPTPAQAKLYPGVRSLLEQAKKKAHIAIMTGRSVEDGAAMVEVEGLTYVGTHGVEWSDGLPTEEHPAHIIPEARAYIEPGQHLLDLAEHELAKFPGLMIECKPVGGSLHCRLCRNPDQVQRELFDLLEEPAREAHMTLRSGKRVIDIQAPRIANKGKALHWFVRRFGLRGVLFAGDDRTDLDALAEIAALRKEGIAALGVVVQYPDTLPALLERADIVVQGVDGMVKLLREIVDMLSPDAL
jgi:trehalose 6-phosphate phosphatase